MNGLRFYRDAGMTLPMDRLDVVQSDDGGAPPADQVVYLGSLNFGKIYYADSNPNVDAITVSVAAGGAGIPASAVRLALSAAGLAGATPGAPLGAGVAITAGVAHAVAVHVRIDADAVAAGVHENLSLTTNATREVTL